MENEEYEKAFSETPEMRAQKKEKLIDNIAIICSIAAIIIAIIILISCF
jgi:hypothetical protein